MPLFSPAITVERPNSGLGGGAHPPAYGGGGDNGPNDSSPNYDRRLRRARLALLLGMVSISVLFITVTTAFVLLRHSTLTLNGRSTYLREWVGVDLPIRLLLLNTLVLLISSVSMELARRAMNREVVLAPVRAIPGIALEAEWRFPWLAATAILGLTFLGGQWKAWQVLLSHGFSIHSSASSSFVYLLTAAHAIHLSGGVLVLFYAAVASILKYSLEHRRIVIEIASWYWHFMGVLWIYIFALIRFAL